MGQNGLVGTKGDEQQVERRRSQETKRKGNAEKHQAKNKRTTWFTVTSCQPARQCYLEKMEFFNG